MPKRSRRLEDVNQIAANIVAQSTGQTLPIVKPKPAKNPAAVALGRLGGLKGGPARKAALSQEERRASALKAAQARWNHRTA